MRLSVFLLIFILSCSLKIDQNGTKTPSVLFMETWSKGLAEVNVFSLEQERYGQIYKGQVILIFVKEKISGENYVKLDDHLKPGLEVLKCNYIKKFQTGLYDYSLMQTVMTGLEGNFFGEVLKASATVQDWCGHVFTELKKDGDVFRYTTDSYFEGESKKYNLDLVYYEDGILNAIRMDTSLIPRGEVSMIPSLFFSRLSHRESRAEKATVTLKKNNKESRVEIHYPELSRNIEITFETEFPFGILSITENHLSIFGQEGKIYTTRAVRLKSEWLPYWLLHNNGDSLTRENMLIPSRE